MTANPNAEVYLRGIMPGLSDRQYELRSKLLLAREFANTQIAAGTDGLHEWQLLYFITDAVNAWLTQTMDDDTLNARVEYCRALAKLAVDAGKVFHAGQ